MTSPRTFQDLNTGDHTVLDGRIARFISAIPDFTAVGRVNYWFVVPSLIEGATQYAHCNQLPTDRLPT